MRANKAARELERLEQQTQRSLDQAANQQKLVAQRTAQLGYAPSMRSLDKDGDGESEFSTPEALATAVGASFILGPVGGVLLGVAQGILGKQMKQGMLDQFMAERSAVTDSADLVRNQINELRANENLGKEDQQQLDALEAGLDVGLRNNSAELVQGALKGVQDYTVRQEEQRVADELRVAELGQYRDGVYQGMRKDFQAESSNYVKTMRQGNNALRAYEQGDAASIYAAGKLFEKSLDPDSVVMAQELEGQGTLGNLFQATMNKLSKVAGQGLPIDDELRQEFAGVVDMVLRASETEQINIQQRYVEEAQERELPMKYWDNFNAIKQIPRYEIEGFKNPYAGRNAIIQTGEAIKENAKEAASGAWDWLKQSGSNDLARIRNWIGAGEAERKAKRDRVRELPTN
jgi:hypothetical protein